MNTLGTPAVTGAPDAQGAPSEPQRAIAHADLMALPILRYTGPIHIVHTAEDLAQAQDEFGHETVVGFDTETRPTFRKGAIYPPSLVQVATARAVYLFQFRQVDCADVLRKLMANRHLIKAGVALNNDLVQLRKLFDFEAHNVLDLGEAARKHGCQQTGVRNLVGIFLHARITKSARTSNWARANLTRSQQIYAATDAWICRELYLRFVQRGLLPNTLPDPDQSTASISTV